MTASKPASVTGYGTIYQAEIKSSGVSFASSVRVSGYTIANGVTATAGGQTLTGSVTAAVSPESIAVDLNNLSALGKNVAVTVPNGLKIEKIESNGAVLAAGTDYTQTSTGAAISADWLGRLPRGSYKLTLMLSDGKTAVIAIAVTDSSVSENVQNASFDRYYKSEKYADVHTRLSGANTSEDIRDVVLGLSSIDYTFDSSTRSLILPRGVLAQLRAGSYTISVELKKRQDRGVYPDRERFRTERRKLGGRGVQHVLAERTEVHAAADAHKRAYGDCAEQRRDRSTQRRQRLHDQRSDADAEKVCARALPQGRYGCRIQRRSGGRHGVCPRYRLCKAQIR